jgi:hypothetical protein
MIKYYKDLIICLFLKHKWISAGSCPFTGKAYDVCTRCTATKIKGDAPIDNKLFENQVDFE